MTPVDHAPIVDHTPRSKRYRRISTRIWGDDRFLQLSKPQPNAQTLWFFLLTGPCTRAVPGLFPAGEAALSEMLGWPLRAFRRVWRELEQAEMVKADWPHRLVWIPKAIRHNPPESPNVVRGWRSILDETHECALRSEALISLRDFCEAFGDAFLKAFHEGFAEAFREGPSPSRQSLCVHPSPNQEQDQDQEQEKELARANGNGNGNGNGHRVIADDSLDARVRGFIERYPRIYAKCRTGATFRVREARDFGAFQELVDRERSDERLDQLLELYLQVKAKDFLNSPGTPRQFLHMLPECDRLLREHGR